jgi:hypothetical protein
MVLIYLFSLLKVVLLCGDWRPKREGLWFLKWHVHPKREDLGF